MRFIFYSIFLIVLISAIVVILSGTSYTGAVPNTPYCVGAHTYAAYRTLEEKADVEEMYKQAGFVPVSEEPAPASFHKSGYMGFLCMKRDAKKTYIQHQQRERAVTQGSSI